MPVSSFILMFVQGCLFLFVAHKFNVCLPCIPSCDISHFKYPSGYPLHTQREMRKSVLCCADVQYAKQLHASIAHSLLKIEVAVGDAAVLSASRCHFIQI
jgi:hypothetical protein